MEPDIVLPSGTQLDTDSGVVTSSSGVQVTSVVVTQGATSIRVFLGRSFSIGNVTVTGTNAFAVVAGGTITVTGQVAANGRSDASGPGSQRSGACVGTDVAVSCSQECGPGAGGGGNATAGGDGGGNGVHPLAGTPVTSFTPLLGGCRGGSFHDSMRGIMNRGGGGGGAVELVALGGIVLISGGAINVGGGGGWSNSGGGSGGTLVLEAPHIRIEGPIGIGANGGAGGACAATGADADLSTTPAHAPSTCPYFGGDGGTGGTIAAAGYLCTLTICTITDYGGGGGAVGRLRIATKDGTIESVGAPVLSAAITMATLQAR
jgi:hypothetical protein